MKQREWQGAVFSKKLDERSWTDGTKKRDSFGGGGLAKEIHSYADDIRNLFLDLNIQGIIEYIVTYVVYCTKNGHAVVIYVYFLYKAWHKKHIGNKLLSQG